MKSLLLSIIGSVLMVACSQSRPSDDITMAERAIEHHDYGMALDLCQQVTQDSSQSLGITDLCRLSILYMKLSDLKDLEDNAIVATDYYRKAMTACEDSARAYYNQIPIDDARYVELMMQLGRILDQQRENDGEEIIPDYEHEHEFETGLDENINTNSDCAI
ncbi:MAG: hypothetical protein K2G40_01690 [Muribaculaceae bacterium]|nr:hypothetical protein [Muribaculaceae bacterium]